MRLSSLPGVGLALMFMSAVIMKFVGVVGLLWNSVGLGMALLCSLLIFVLANYWRTAKVKRVLSGKRIGLGLYLSARDSRGRGVLSELHIWTTNKITRGGARVSTLTDTQAFVLNDGGRIDGSWNLAVCGEVIRDGNDCDATVHFVATRYSCLRILTVDLHGRSDEVAEQIVACIVKLLEQHRSLEEARNEPVAQPQ